MALPESIRNNLEAIAKFCERYFYDVFVRQDGSSEMSASAYPVLEVERHSTATNSVYTVAAFRHRTTTDMSDGFGSAIGFEIEDDGGTENLIATIQGIRDGADNSGKVAINLRDAGTWAPTEYEFQLKGFKAPQSVANISNPPLDSELDAEFGTPAALGRGFMATIDDNSEESHVYLILTCDNTWWNVALSKST